MKVTVIIPTYNEEKTIGECLASLGEQTHKDMEVIVVDDGSGDDTVGVVSKFKVTNYKLQLIKQDHKGAGAARNKGVGKARGEILVFVDADMTFDRNFIGELVKPIVAGEAIGTFSKEEFLANKENVWARCWNLNRGLPSDQMHPKDYPDKQKVFRAILKREFDGVGGFDEKAGYTDDWSLSERLGLAAVAVPGARFYHRNPESLREVWVQSKWMAKRRYKLGAWGAVVALVRFFLPVSLVVGLAGAIGLGMPEFLVFKLVADGGGFIGVGEWLWLKRVAK